VHNEIKARQYYAERADPVLAVAVVYPNRAFIRVQK
jgi:hypothetical protein